MKKIIVLTDFSPASHNACRYAVSLANEMKAQISLVNVTPPSVLVSDSMFATVMITQAEIIQQNKDLMSREIERLSKQDGKKIQGVVREGFIVDIISAMVSKGNADLVVMGMKGRGQSNSVFGSTTISLIRKSDYPILVIPEKAGYTKIDKITYASDFATSIQLESLSALIKMAAVFSAQVSILHVEKNNRFTPENVRGKMNTSHHFSGINHSFHSVYENNVEEGIHKFIEQNPCALLAMVAHKHSLFERTFGKVHTKEMSFKTRIPLLVLQG